MTYIHTQLCTYLRSSACTSDDIRCMLTHARTHTDLSEHFQLLVRQFFVDMAGPDPVCSPVQGSWALGLACNMRLPAFIACGLARPEQGDLARHVPGSAEAGALQLCRSVPHLLVAFTELASSTCV